MNQKPFHIPQPGKRRGNLTGLTIMAGMGAGAPDSDDDDDDDDEIPGLEADDGAPAS